MWPKQEAPPHFQKAALPPLPRTVSPEWQSQPHQSRNATRDAEQQVWSLNRNDRNSIHSQKTGSSGLINIYFYDICEAETHRSMTNASLKSLPEFPIATVTEACLSFLWKFQHISNEYISFWIGCVSQSSGRVVLKILFITHPSSKIWGLKRTWLFISVFPNGKSGERGPNNKFFICAHTIYTKHKCTYIHRNILAHTLTHRLIHAYMHTTYIYIHICIYTNIP